MTRVVLAASLLLFSCPSTSTPDAAVDCRQDGACPEGLTCFPDFRCYPPGADVDCSPPCYGVEPFCDQATLRCVACLGDGDCPAGQVCVAPVKRCQAGCSEAKPDCPAGTTCDLALGACRGCLTDAECLDPAFPRCDAQGQCVTCVEDRDDCPPGQFCNTAGAAPACAPGCKASSECDAGQDCCAHHCVDTTTDSSHCGFCDNACRSGRACCTGRCVDVTTDVDNCSTCGTSCSLPNVAAPYCAAATCGHQGCEFYFGNCDGDWANGCEANFSFDAQNCGGCGRPCGASAPHTVGACNLGTCTLACVAGWGNCDVAWLDGCEVDLTSTTAHCGRCDNPCPGAQTCVAGQCQ